MKVKKWIFILLATASVFSFVLPSFCFAESSLNLDCGSCILIEQHSGQVLYEQNCHEKLRPASVTKVMTILLIMEALDNR